MHPRYDFKSKIQSTSMFSFEFEHVIPYERVYLEVNKIKKNMLRFFAQEGSEVDLNLINIMQ